MVLRSEGDDPQTDEISVDINSFSRPVLNFKIKPREDSDEINVFVCHFKSKTPTQLYKESWFKKPIHGKHANGIGSALSTIRRTAEAAALRVILTEYMKGNDKPAIVLGDINDGQHSNTVNIITEQPNYLFAGQTGGGDVSFYTAQTLQQYRSLRHIYYTHIYKNTRETLDHILVSQEFYDNSRKRIWAFQSMTISNDHINQSDHKENGTSDHGIVKTTFKYKPIKSDS